MRVIAYTYEADFHCAPCTLARNRADIKAARVRRVELELDENGVAVHAKDREGNPFHPVFSTDELAGDEVCGGCLEAING